MKLPTKQFIFIYFMQVPLSAYPKTREVKEFRVEGYILSLLHLVALHSLSSFLILMSTGQAGVCSLPLCPPPGHRHLGVRASSFGIMPSVASLCSAVSKNHHTLADLTVSRQLHYHAGHDRQADPRAPEPASTRTPSPQLYISPRPHILFSLALEKCLESH